MSHHDITIIGAMGRWEPDAAGRLREAAMELYRDQGYDETTVAQIAERAGVTARTFFRHFADKREVLFGGSEELQARMTAAIAAAPSGVGPLDLVAAALDAAAAMIGGDHAHSKRRMAVLLANPELRERELIKMARLGDAVTAALTDRGLPDAEARLAAEAGIAVFRIGFERWVDGPRTGDLAEVLRHTSAQLRDLVAD